MAKINEKYRTSIVDDEIATRVGMKRRLESRYFPQVGLQGTIEVCTYESPTEYINAQSASPPIVASLLSLDVNMEKAGKKPAAELFEQGNPLEPGDREALRRKISGAYDAVKEVGVDLPAGPTGHLSGAYETPTHKAGPIALEEALRGNHPYILNGVLAVVINSGLDGNFVRSDPTLGQWVERAHHAPANHPQVLFTRKTAEVIDSVKRIGAVSTYAFAAYEAHHLNIQATRAHIQGLIETARHDVDTFLALDEVTKVLQRHLPEALR
jgi:hypothetical protein